MAIVVSFQGGRDLAWADVKTIWTRAYTHLTETLLKTYCRLLGFRAPGRVRADMAVAGIGQGTW